MTGAIAEVASMNFEPGTTNQGGGRWYPTLVTLATGEVLAVAGHPDLLSFIDLPPCQT